MNKMRKLTFIAMLGFTGVSALAAGKSQTLTGEVSDSMCGAQHMMKGKAGDCARACVSKGSSYALVVGDKVYSLHASDKGAHDELGRRAGEKATVTGTLDGETVEVSKVAPAR
jgi:hypothetical protein